MALSVYTPNYYTGAGSTDTFAYSFKIFDEADLLVIQKDSTTFVETTLVLNTDYTVTGVGVSTGGNVVLDAGNLASGQTLVIKRVVDLTQETDIRNQGEFLPEIHEEEFDKLVMADQQIQEEVNRSLKIPAGIDPSDFDMTLPADVSDNAGAAILVNDDGDGLTLGSTSAVTDTTKLAKAGGTMTGNIVMANQTEVRLGDLDNSNYVGIKSPSVVASSFTLTAPSALPSAAGGIVSSSTGVMTYSPHAIHSVTNANYTILDTDSYRTILVSAGASNRTITLPTAADNSNRILTVKKTDSGVGAVILDGEGAETIDGSSTKTIRQQYESITILCDGTSWHVVDRDGIITNFIAYTPTGAFTTNSTYTGMWRRVGDQMEIKANIAFAGAPNSVSGTILIPTGYTVDTAKLVGTAAEVCLGIVQVLDAGVATYHGRVLYSTGGTTLSLAASTSNATYTYEATITQAVPHTFGNGDSIIIEASFPVTEFAL